MLEDIQSKDIKNMTMDQLRALAKEIRARLIEVCAKNGGHLAPNLGIVEITLALHYVYDFPKDKLVWDVGHQAYVHKLLTGRNDRFDTLRQYGGVSGFPKRSESIYDDFGAGHASTSISAADGFAVARDLFHEDRDVIAVIGDGAMTGGMAFEALNYAAHLQTKMTVILNDNEMSIGPNVGGMSQYLTRMRTDPGYNRFKEDMEYFLKRIPNIGPRMAEMADRLKDTVKHMLTNGSWFEELGLRYYGPVNGHDIEELIHVFENSKQFDCPVLIHCLTEKGRGYLPAQKNPGKFHGVGAFDISTGETLDKSTQPSYTKVFANTLVDLAASDSRICGITAAMASGTGMDAFHKAYPKRAFDVGIAEEHATTMASAMALSGLKPVVAIYSTFMQRAYDQLIHDTALSDLHVVFAVDRAGMVGADGETHHGIFDATFLSEIPNMTVLCPSNFAELRTMLDRAVNEIKGPVAIRYPRGGEGAFTADTSAGDFAELRTGKDITLCAYGTLINNVLGAAELLHEDGIEARVVKLNRISPFRGGELSRIFGTTKRLLVAEECSGVGCIGQRIAAILAEEGHEPQRLMLCNLGRRFIEQGSVGELYRQCGLDAESLARTAKEVCQ